MSETILERIVAATRADLEERKARVPLDELRERIAAVPPPRDFAAALHPHPAGPARLIAEVKRASPSKGLIAERFDPVAQAQAYEAGGAAAISVLTEPHFFQGSLEHLAAVRAAVSLPVLRKDFIFDPYMVYEARAAGADAVLLLCSLLEDAALRELLGLARRLGMEALVEAHDAEEVRRAVASGATVIGVNARDLRTFAVDTDVVRHLRPLVPDDRIFVAESGISTATHAARARAWGADAILVGKALMRSTDPAAKAKSLSSAAGGATAAFFAGTGRPFIKVCGLTTPEQIRVVTRLGADAFGLVFAPMAPDHRRLTPERAAATMQTARSDLAVRRSQRPLPRAVGVFVNEEPEIMAEIARMVGLDAIQLSGDETVEQCAEVRSLTGLPVLKALRLRGNPEHGCTALTWIDSVAEAGATLLLDTPVPGSYGGTGETSDWGVARWMATQWPVILAGGLTPENIADAIATVQPRGVDVSSGVETDRAKDPEKIARFIAAAREAAALSDP